MDNALRRKKKKDEKLLLSILLPAAAMIFCSALEALMLVKDSRSYELWLSANPSGNADRFISMQLMIFLFSCLYPVACSLYSVFALPRTGPDLLYRAVWGMLGLCVLVSRLLAFRFDSLFYDLGLVFLLLLIVAIFRSGKRHERGVINKELQ